MFKSKDYKLVYVISVLDNFIKLILFEEYKIVIYRYTIYINEQLIDLCLDVYEAYVKNNLLYIICSDTAIVIINIKDYSIVSTYYGVCDKIVNIQANESYLYILTSNRDLYRTRYTNLSYDLVCKEVQSYCLDEYGEPVICNYNDKVTYKGMIKEYRDMNIEGIYCKKSEIVLITSCGVINMQTKENEKIADLQDVTGDFVKTGEMIYDLQCNYVYNRNGIDDIIRANGKIYARKGNVLYQVEIID